MSGLLFLAPAPAPAMLARRYPGERHVVALCARRRRGASRRTPARVRLAPVARAPWALVPRAGALLACAPAPPPPVVLVS